MIIQKGLSEDLEEIIDFGNYVFSHNGRRVDFPSLLPKLYTKGYEMEQYHYIVKENERIKGMVGAFPDELKIGEQCLKVSGIGTVSAHPYSRGKGYMKALMTKATEDMQQEGIDISVLSGKKQRYEHFGYAVVGTAIEFELPLGNMHEILGDNEAYEVRAVTAKDQAVIEACYQLHKIQPIRYERKADRFYDICMSWYGRLWSIYKADIFVGYMITSKDQKSVSEILLIEEQELKNVLTCYMKQYQLDAVNLSVGAYEVGRIEALRRVCEDYSIGTATSVRVFNFEKVLQVLLTLKASYTALLEGQVALAIKGHGTYAITVEKEKVTVTTVQKEADLTLEYFDAMDLLFSPLSTSLYHEQKVSPLLRSYFPLPIYIQSADKV